jgi:hypothetical protein
MKVARYEVPGMRAKQYPSRRVRFESRYSPGQPFDEGILVGQRIQHNAETTTEAEPHTVPSGTGSVTAPSRHFVPATFIQSLRDAEPADNTPQPRHSPARRAPPLTSPASPHSAANTARAQFSSVTNPLIQLPRNAPSTAIDLCSPPAKAITGFFDGRGN